MLFSRDARAVFAASICAVVRPQSLPMNPSPQLHRALHASPSLHASPPSRTHSP